MFVAILFALIALIIYRAEDINKFEEAIPCSKFSNTSNRFIPARCVSYFNNLEAKDK